jgi:cytochrome c553
VQSLTDQDIADLAAFFSVQTPAGLEADPSYWEAGKALYRGGDVQRQIPACIACHGPVGRGVPAAGFPALQAQHSVYTVAQLNAYANDSRFARDDRGRSLATPHAHMMTTISGRLTAEERRNLASYLQGMR